MIPTAIPSLTGPLTGFLDADAWTRRSDGVIVGRARNNTWAEIARNLVPIERFLEEAPPVESVLYTDPEPEPSYEEAPSRPTCTCIACQMRDEYVDDAYYYASYEYDMAFRKADAYDYRVAPRKKHTAPKKAQKAPKFGPKATKTHTVAAKLLVEPLPANDYNPEEPPTPILSLAPVPIFPKQMPPTLADAIAAWFPQLQEFAEEHDDFELTDQDLEDERLMQRIRDSRGGRY
jgi:hypothetical protein